MNIRTSSTIISLTLIAAILVSICTMTSPTPKDQINGFSAERAYRHLEFIAQKQHSVFDLQEIEEVRNYLEETIDAFENVRWTRIKHPQIEVLNHKIRAREPIDIDNIYAEIPGTSGRYLLLVAHFDSCPYKEKYGVATDGSYGAADDGYGLATMLEIMRLLNDYAAENELINGVKFAFTDAEEVALGGATALVKEFSYWLQDVNIVLNLEARGNKGPLYMFQTGDNNYKLVDFYRHARLPFSFSITAEVYRHLPNDTDFTPFLKAGYTGLNFATLNSLKYYHTPFDNLDNAHKPTLQFYGEQIYPLVKEYINHERYGASNAFVSNNNAVFFTLLPGVIIYYSQILSWIFVVFATLSMIAITYFAIRKKRLSWKKSLLALCVWAGYLLVAAIVGYLLALCTGWLTGNTFKITYMPNVPFDMGLTVIFVVFILAAALFVAKGCRKLTCSFLEILCGATWLMIVLNTVFAFLLHGGTYLFIWPAAFMMAILTLYLFFSATKKRQVICRQLLQALAVLTTSILYITLIYSLFLALTFGALAVVLLFTSVWGYVLVSSSNSAIFPQRFLRL